MRGAQIATLMSREWRKESGMVQDSSWSLDLGVKFDAAVRSTYLPPSNLRVVAHPVELAAVKFLRDLTALRKERLLLFDR